MKTFLKQLYEVYRPLQWAVMGVLGFIAFGQILNLVGPYLMSRVIDQLAKKEFTGDIYYFFTAMFALWVFRVTAFRIWREKYELNKLDGNVPLRMQEYTLTKLFGFSIGQHTNESSGIKRSVIGRGENALKNMVEQLVYQALPIVIEILILTCVLLYWAPPIGLIVLASLVIGITFIWKLNSEFSGDFKEIERLNIQDSKLEGEVIGNISMVIAQAQEDRAMKECKNSRMEAYTFTKNVWIRFINWAAFRDSIPQLARFLVVLVSIYYVRKGTYTIGQFMMFTSWTSNALGNLGEMSGLHRQIIRSYTSIRKYFEMLSIEPDVKVIENPVRPEKFAGRIEFKDVTFRYLGRDVKSPVIDDEEDGPPDTSTPKVLGPALDNVSFVIEAGQTVACVGESGAGKSTLVNAIIRSQDPESGQIIVDGNDLRVIDLKHYRESIGIVSQEVSLFDQTLKYNITYGLNGRSSAVTDHELRDVAELSRIDRFYDRLEKGFDTIIGERGVKLSGGERQRVGIARALIKKPDILIFDEATSNLDAQNEAMIRESIEGAAKGRTTIIIAHRFSTIRNVDKVFVFDRGKIVGEGTHEELAVSCEAYQRLVKNQQ